MVFYQAYSYRLINLTLVIFLGYFYNLGDFHSDILIEAIHIKKECARAQKRCFIAFYWKCLCLWYFLTFTNIIKRFYFWKKIFQKSLSTHVSMKLMTGGQKWHFVNCVNTWHIIYQWKAFGFSILKIIIVLKIMLNMMSN